MALVYLTRRERFNAAHKLWNAEWTEEENLRVFGKCSNKNWHGHNYELFVTVKGTPDPVTGFVCDLKKLSQLVNKKVIDVVDHRNLNLDVPFMNGKVASTEVLCIAVWEELAEEVKNMGCSLYSIRIHETENNYAEYRGE